MRRPSKEEGITFSLKLVETWVNKGEGKEGFYTFSLSWDSSAFLERINWRLFSLWSFSLVVIGSRWEADQSHEKHQSIIKAMGSTLLFFRSNWPVSGIQPSLPAQPRLDLLFLNPNLSLIFLFQNICIYNSWLAFCIQVLARNIFSDILAIIHGWHFVFKFWPETFFLIFLLSYIFYLLICLIINFMVKCVLLENYVSLWVIITITMVHLNRSVCLYVYPVW